MNKWAVLSILWIFLFSACDSTTLKEESSSQKGTTQNIITSKVPDLAPKDLQESKPPLQVRTHPTDGKSTLTLQTSPEDSLEITLSHDQNPEMGEFRGDLKIVRHTSSSDAPEQIITLYWSTDGQNPAIGTEALETLTLNRQEFEQSLVHSIPILTTHLLIRWGEKRQQYVIPVKDNVGTPTPKLSDLIQWGDWKNHPQAGERNVWQVSTQQENAGFQEAQRQQEIRKVSQSLIEQKLRLPNGSSVIEKITWNLKEGHCLQTKKVQIDETQKQTITIEPGERCYIEATSMEKGFTETFTETIQRESFESGNLDERTLIHKIEYQYLGKEPITVAGNKWIAEKIHKKHLKQSEDNSFQLSEEEVFWRHPELGILYRMVFAPSEAQSENPRPKRVERLLSYEGVAL